jgi:hypothetical protein
LLLGLTTLPAVPGFSQSGAKTGVLTCHTSVRFGLALASRQRLRCEFKPEHSGSLEHYAGHVIHAGHDLSFSAQGVMVWEVVAPANDLPQGALAGLYWRARSNHAAGPGVGAKTLIGRHRPIELEPLAVADANLAFGIEGFRLRSVQ